MAERWCVINVGTRARNYQDILVRRPWGQIGLADVREALRRTLGIEAEDVPAINGWAFVAGVVPPQDKGVQEIDYGRSGPAEDKWSASDDAVALRRVGAAAASLVRVLRGDMTHADTGKAIKSLEAELIRAGVDVEV